MNDSVAAWRSDTRINAKGVRAWDEQVDACVVETRKPGARTRGLGQIEKMSAAMSARRGSAVTSVAHSERGVEVELVGHSSQLRLSSSDYCDRGRGLGRHFVAFIYVGDHERSAVGRFLRSAARASPMEGAPGR